MSRENKGIVVPKFENEAREADWWYKNRSRVANALIQAMDKGTVERGMAQRLTREARASRNITLRMAEADIELARQQAAQKGMPYQTYIKSLLHEALTQRKRRRAS
jgi:predicted DNA binding CopG/RHH family protein